MSEQTWQQWARAVQRDPESPSEIKRGALGALTGQDTRALNAIAACWKLYSNSDDDGQAAAIVAIRALLGGMQPTTRWLARELIPWALDWDDRARLWPLVTRPALQVLPGRGA
jgi:hypothetical protein